MSDTSALLKVGAVLAFVTAIVGLGWWSMTDRRAAPAAARNENPTVDPGHDEPVPPSPGATLSDPRRPEAPTVRAEVPPSPAPPPKSIPWTLRLRVVEADSGAPVEDYGVLCFPVDDQERHPVVRNVQHRGRHADGVLVVGNAQPGRNRVIVHPGSTAWIANPPLEVDVTATGTNVQVELHRRVLLTVIVRLANGAPVAGSHLELLRNDGSGALELNTGAAPLEDAYSAIHTLGPRGVVLDSGVTDAEGRAFLRGPPESGLYVKALGPGHAVAIRPDVTIPEGGASLELVLARGATIKGRVVPLEALAKLTPAEPEPPPTRRTGNPAAAPANERIRIQLREVGGQRRTIPAKPEGCEPLAEDGSFALEGVPAGYWRLDLLLEQRLGEVTLALPREALRIDGLLDGETRWVEVDALALLPGTISGRILLDGEPYRSQSAMFQGSGHSRSFVTDADGGFVTTEHPGEWQLTLLPTGSKPNRRDQWIRHDARLQLRAGEKVHQDFAVVRRRARIRVLEADGTPAVERSIGARMLAPYQEHAPDRDGWIVLDPASPDPMTLCTWPRGTTSTTKPKPGLEVPPGEIQIPKGKTEATFEVRVPADR